MTEQEEFEFRLRFEQEQAAAKPQQAAPSRMQMLKDEVVNSGPVQTALGALRGAGSIGATLMAPFDYAEQGLESLMGAPKRDVSINAQRRTDMDAGAQSLGMNPDSLWAQGGSIGAQVAGTAPVGGILGGAAARMGASAPVVQSLTSGGLNVGGRTGLAGLATRAAGGAATGAATAGLVDPGEAALGAVIGGAMPLLTAAGGVVGERVGKHMQTKADNALLEFSRNAPKNQTLKESLEAGYVVPPNMAKPSFMNQTIESISGKQATQQLFSEKNEKVTGSLVRKSLGIPDDAPLTQSTLENLRKTAGKVYADVSALSKQAADDLEALKVARNEAQAWFKHYNTTAHPDSLAKAKELRALSDSLETALEQHAANAGKTSLIPALREARKQIAKTYTVGRALNDAAGTVDARILGRMHEKGLPLSDGLDVAGKFASAFKTVAKSSPEVGSAGAHNMKALASSVLGVGGGMSAGIPGIGLAAIPFLAPPVARAAMLRNGVQKGLVSQTPKAADSALAKILMDQDLQRLMLRTAPVVSANSGP